MKVGLRSLAPLQISGLRIFSGAAVARGAAGRLPRPAAPRPAVWAHLVVSAFFLCTLPFSLFALGEQRVSSALAGIGNATTPIATVVFSLLLLRGDVIGRRKVVGVLVGFLGVLVIMQPWQSTGRPDLVGFGMTLVAGASYGLGWTYNKRFLRGSDLGGLSLPAAQLTVAVRPDGGGRAPGLVGDQPPTGCRTVVGARTRPRAGPCWRRCWRCSSSASSGTGIAFSLQFDVMREAGPTVGASVTYLIPVVSVALGVLALDEQLHGRSCSVPPS